MSAPLSHPWPGAVGEAAKGHGVISHPPGILPMLDTSVTLRFWALVAVVGVRADECWEWRGATRNGYGAVALVGRTLYRAHRVAWVLANQQEIPERLVVLHSCDNPPCVNPAHLRAGTRSDNMQDAIAKGRRPAARPRPVPAPRERKLMCLNGHLRTPDNVNAKGACRTCRREHDRLHPSRQTGKHSTRPLPALGRES